MPSMINGTTEITQGNIENITNASGLAELMVNVNHQIYGGKLIFIMLFTLFIILAAASYRKAPYDILKHMMTSSAIVSILAILFIGVQTYSMGVKGLITDAQMWVFPILTVTLAAIVRSKR